MSFQRILMGSVAFSSENHLEKLHRFSFFDFCPYLVILATFGYMGVRYLFLTQAGRLYFLSLRNPCDVLLSNFVCVFSLVSSLGQFVVSCLWYVKVQSMSVNFLPPGELLVPIFTNSLLILG